MHVLTNLVTLRHSIVNLEMAKVNIKEWSETRPKTFDFVEQVVQFG